jgi:hypothetical protein
MSALFPKPTVMWAFAFLEERKLFVAYLDEFGHIGPYVSRDDQHYNESPVFGLAGLILPHTHVRQFGTWFFQRKCELLKFEIDRSGKHPATWEKKGSSLYTRKNIENYPELTRFTKRFLNHIVRCGGHVFYVGMHKTSEPSEHKPIQMYLAVLREAMKRLDQFAESSKTNLLIIIDEHQERDALVTEASRAMFHPDHPCSCLIEPPVQVESHRYQTVQAADWICGLMGRLGAYGTAPKSFPDFGWAEALFGFRVAQAQVRSGIRRFGPPTGRTKS